MTFDELIEKVKQEYPISDAATCIYNSNLTYDWVVSIDKYDENEQYSYSFYRDGKIVISNAIYNQTLLSKHRTPAQMYQIITALTEKGDKNENTY